MRRFLSRTGLLLFAVSCCCLTPPAWSFLIAPPPPAAPKTTTRREHEHHQQRTPTVLALSESSTQQQPRKDDAWAGEVVPGDGRIRGCTLTQVEGSLTEWVVRIDGVDADLGGFSSGIYKKMLQDAKQQRFQGFRPGTVPPHLLNTYRAFAMDECARETVLEALQQNSIRPFENCRSELELVDFCIPPAPAKSSKKKKSKKRKKGAAAAALDENAATPEEDPAAAVQWRTFGTMKEALDAGWSPGQSFSFVAKKVTGQQIKDDDGAKAVARPY